ncbi:Uncharacterised protein [Haemophilus parahaemolyticus]|uniref:Uncharacterized protein n=1 Tax=Haemophilus parahaemolyticus TaxID=735 RepID=A0A377HZU7_HAEPH|nr:Uncharacterised protein [Haemophilus parahaemolyticus]
MKKRLNNTSHKKHPNVDVFCNANIPCAAK